MSRRHIPALDGLRGIAVLGVVAHHLDLLTGGYLGVDAFFVLSGFLITGLLVDEASGASPEGPPIRLGTFWKRRAKRLLPALGALLLTVLVVERWVIDSGQRAVELRDETIATVAYVYNWYAIREGVDYWSSFEAPSPLRHMWSLAIEEQFYLFWPLVALAAALVARRRSWSMAPTMLTVAGVGALASVLISQVVYDPRDVLRSYYGTDVRVAAILFGAAAAMLVRRWPDLDERRRHRIGVAGAAATVPIAWAWIALDGESTLLYRGGLVLTGLATAGVLIATVLAPASLLAKVLSWRVLMWFGTISYGLYLWHWPIIVWLTPGRVGLDGVALLALRLGVSLAATVVSYHVIEQPIRRADWTGRATAGWSIAALSGVVVLATVGVSSGTTDRVAAGTRDTTPIPTLASTTTRATPPSTTAPSTMPATTERAQPGTTTTIAASTSTTSEPAPALERLLVVGDSGAYFLGPPLVTAAGTDVVVVQRGQVGCGLVTEGGGVVTGGGGFLADAADCATFPERLHSDVEAFQPTHVLFVYSWPGIGERELDGDFVQPCDRAFDERFELRLSEAIEIAGSTGAVVVVADTPYFVDPSGSLAATDLTDCLNASVSAVVDGLTDSGVTPLELAAWTCPDGICRLEVDGVPLRPDGLHFEGPGGDVAAEWIIGQLVR